MSKGINKVIIIGNLGRDPETRYMPSGSAVTNCAIATSESWKDKESGERQERTEWHRVVFFNKLAEIAGQYLKKGSKVYIEGSLRTRSYDKDGQKHYATEIVASEMQMLDGRQGGGDNQGFDEEQAARTPPRQQRPAPAGGGGGGGDFDDDIPFARLPSSYSM